MQLKRKFGEDGSSFPAGLIKLVSPVRYLFFLYRYLYLLYSKNTTVRRIRRLAMYSTEYHTQLI